MMTNPIHITRIFRAERLRRQHPRYIHVQPNTVAMNDGHLAPSIFTRLAQFWVAERADYVIGCIGVVGVVIAFVWSVVDWMALKGWL